VPKDLAALLVEEGAVPAEAMERALERQRDAGGTLDTALLELGAVSEPLLMEHLSRAAELPPAPEHAWVAADARARRVFPSRVAERHGLAPFALDGRELSLVATYPVDLALLDEISFMLSLHLTPHVGPEWRVRELIHRLYGTPLPERLAVVAAAAGAPVVAAPDADQDGSAAPAHDPGAFPSRGGFSRDDAEPFEPLAAALQHALESVDVSPLDDEEEAGGEREAPEPERPAPDRSAPPRWSLDDARAALASARGRDEVVLTALRYARDFFEYAAVFAVTRDAVAGHDALGAEDERDRARTVAIWASDAGIFRTVIETRSPYLGPVSRDAAGNEAILSGLGRGVPRTVLVHPVLLRDRPICVLYADNGEAPVSARRLGDLLLFLSAVGAALERIIRDRKRRVRRRARAAVAAPFAAAADPAAEPPAGAAPEPAERDPAGAAQQAGPDDRAPETLDAEQEPAEDEAAMPWVDVDVELGESAEAQSAGTPSALETVSSTRSLEDGPSSGAARSEEAGALRSSQEEPAPGPQSPQQEEPAPSAHSPQQEPATVSPSPLVLAERALEADPAVATVARDALARQRRDPGIRPAAEKLRRALLSGLSGRVMRAASALGALRDVESVPLLIQAIETSDPRAASAAADALASITLQRLGPDARAWLAWWKDNRGRGRAEWLFSGLTSPDRETRVAASAELSLAAPPPVAYSADLPAAQRESAARAWAGWWARSGQVL
jgi:hypothetical protein